MRTECTCGVVLKDEPAEGGISHGLCPACYRNTMRAFLEGLTFVELTYELDDARGEAAVTTGVVLAEAREWLALVESEIEARGGLT